MRGCCEGPVHLHTSRTEISPPSPRRYLKFTNLTMIPDIEGWCMQLTKGFMLAAAARDFLPDTVC